MTKVVYVGNFRPEYSTENDVADALARLGTQVVTVQEDDWAQGRCGMPDPDSVDMVLWTRTWPVPSALAEVSLQPFKAAGVPVVGYHLDRWWGLSRSRDLYSDPYWAWMDTFFTADPGTAHWARLGVNAVWTPPAVSERHLEPVTLPRHAPYPNAVVAFVGNTDETSYHPEHQHRFAMLDVLRRRYGSSFVEIPGRGRPAIRGPALTHIYGTVPVIVGDSCLAGLDAYWSDRVPETVGRAGLLVHPWTDWAGQYEPGQHLLCWRLGDWDGLCGLIDSALADSAGRDRVRFEGAAHVRAGHTYTVRMRRVLEMML